jgi:hypothetical protein
MWEKGIAEFLSNAHNINSSLVVLAGNILSFAHVKKNASQDAVTGANKFINDKIIKLAGFYAAEFHLGQTKGEVWLILLQRV